MSTIERSVDTLAPGAVVRDRAVPVPVLGAVTSTDHKVIGRNFVAGAIAGLAASLVVGVLLGVERIDGGDALLDDGAINQLFTANRVGLIYGALVPLLLGVAVGIVPLQVGARALALPRLAAAGFWTWLGGLALVVVSLAANGGPLGGEADMVDLFIAAHALLVIGLAAAAISVATTILTSRAPGMRLYRLPFFSWGALVASVGLVLVLPVLVGDAIYLFVDHRYGRTLFGGNSGIGVWMGWAWTQPTTYLFALPAIALLAELVPVVFQKRTPMRSVVYAGLALVGVGALSAVSQQAHVVAWDGSAGDKLEDLVVWAFFLLVPVLGVLVVTGIVALMAKPTKGGPRPAISAPFLFAFFGAELVFAGMLAGAVNHIADLGLIGTVFEEGATTLVVFGGVLAGLGAVTYWIPKWTGHLAGSKPAMGLALLGALATVLAAAPYLVAGFADQPAGSPVYEYSGPAELWNVLATVGQALMLLVVLGVAGLVVNAFRGRGEAADADPWRGHTLEWLTTSPAPSANFVDPPTVASPEPVYDLRATPIRENQG